jgi:hypothetical protein
MKKKALVSPTLAELFSRLTEHEFHAMVLEEHYDDCDECTKCSCCGEKH